MPRIIVQAELAGGALEHVTLAERVIPTAAHNEHYLAQLAERLSWALRDAEDLEARLQDGGDPEAGSFDGEPRPEIVPVLARAAFGPRAHAGGRA